jgi:hypothetical protein
MNIIRGLSMLLLSSATIAQADQLQIDPTLEANGVYYQVISFWDLYASENLPTSTLPNWTTAETYAQSITFDGVQGNLASIPDSSLDSALWKLVVASSNPNEPIGGIFLGGERINNTWQWVDGQNFSYANWAPGEPNNLGGNENYLSYWWSNTKPYTNNPGWNDTTLTSFDASSNKATTWGFLVEFNPKQTGGGGVSTAPLPTSLWLFMAGFLGILGLRTKKQ